jgi:hypothetical protein
MKRVTRRQAKVWLAPIRECFTKMRSGYSEAIRGYAVTRLNDSDEWVRSDYCIAGFVGLIQRLFPTLETPSMLRVQMRLANGVLISQKDLDLCMRELQNAEDLLITKTTKKLKKAVTDEQIKIEIDALMEERIAA